MGSVGDFKPNDPWPLAALTATAVDAEQWWHDIREGGDELSGPDAPSDPWERVRGEH